MDMGYPNFGGGPADMTNMAGMAGMPPGVSDAALTGPTTGPPDVAVTLVARKEKFRLASGQTMNGFTLNHQSPGPTIRATQGDVLQVTLVNASVPEGVTLHWHGVDVPNADDGVAGVTQNAVRVGGSFVYKFRITDAGTYWYHSHQDSFAEVSGGLFGALVVEPRPTGPTEAAPTPIAEATETFHTYGKLATINGRTGLQRITAPAGSTERVRIIDTDMQPIGVAVSGTTYRLISHDGRDINKPTDLDQTAVLVAAGGRIDLSVNVPTNNTAALVDLGNGAELAIGATDAAIAPEQAADGQLDFSTYGSPAPIGFDPTRPDRRFDYRIARQVGFENGKPGDWWTIDGHKFPDVPMFEVTEGDVVVMTISNSSSLHPMHLHGHHAVVLSRNGVPTTGSPWWFDSLDVETGSTYVIAFVADNPGIWMDHCHNLRHAADGLLAHLAYTGVTEPYVIGGPAHNDPE
jgi:FtsP/CotA-like multicopper oxidase with cupredoxin domain